MPLVWVWEKVLRQERLSGDYSGASLKVPRGIHYQGWWQPLNVLYRASWKGQMLHEAPDSAHHFWIANFFKLLLRMFPSSGVPDV